MTTTATALGGTGAAAGAAAVTNATAGSPTGGSAPAGGQSAAAGATGAASGAAAGAQSGSTGAGTSGTGTQGQNGAAGDAAGAAAKAAEGAAADITLKLPDGVQADTKLLESFRTQAKELGLKSEVAQKVLDLYLGEQQRAQAAGQKAWDDQQSGWANALKADKEYGGALFDASLVTARKAIEKFATPELRKAMDETGLGNHPEFVRFAYRVGKALAEDSISGKGGTGAVNPKGSDAVLRTMYPTMFKE